MILNAPPPPPEFMDKFFTYFLTAVFLVGLMLYILESIARWKLYERAGRTGWHAMVPVLRELPFLDIAGKSRWWAVTVAVFNVCVSLQIIFMLKLFMPIVQVAEAGGAGNPPAGIGGPGSFVQYFGMTFLFGALTTISNLTWFILRLIAGMSFSPQFGRSEWFGVGIAFMPYVFFPVIAFSGSVYGGKKAGQMSVQTET
jgi:hypothetical protein